VEIVSLAEAKVSSLCKELAKKLINKEITSKQVWESLDEIEKYKVEQKIINKGWRQ
jgi:hypothetical protein